MFLVLSPFLVLLGLIVLHVTAQNSHFLVEFASEVEIVELTQTKLAIIVIETFFGDADQSRGVLQVEPAIE